MSELQLVKHLGGDEEWELSGVSLPLSGDDESCRIGSFKIRT